MAEIEDEGELEDVRLKNENDCSRSEEERIWASPARFSLLAIASQSSSSSESAVHRTLHRQSERLAKVATNGLDGEKRRQLLALLRQVRDNLESL
jgi:hypothetical protein